MLRRFRTMMSSRAIYKTTYRCFLLLLHPAWQLLSLSYGSANRWQTPLRFGLPAGCGQAITPQLLPAH